MSRRNTQLASDQGSWWSAHRWPAVVFRAGRLRLVVYRAGVAGFAGVAGVAGVAGLLLAGSGASVAMAATAPSARAVGSGPLDPGGFNGLVPPAPHFSHSPPDPSAPAATRSGRTRPLDESTQWRAHTKAGAVTLRMTQPQLQSVWCAPAAGRAALSSIMQRPPAQSWLAAAMGTGREGTLMSAIAPALNRSQQRTKYQLDFATSPNVLLSRVRMDVERYRSAVIIGVDPGQLPWYEGLLPLGGGHAVVVHGYSVNASGGSLLVWDPARSPLAGRHRTSISALTAAGVRFGGAIVW